MEEFKVKKIYKTEQVDAVEAVAETYIDNGETKQRQVNKPVKKEVQVLTNSIPDAMSEASKEADKKKYVSVSLLKEDSEFYYFQLYNKKVEEVKPEPLKDKTSGKEGEK